MKVDINQIKKDIEKHLAIKIYLLCIGVISLIFAIAGHILFSLMMIGVALLGLFVYDNSKKKLGFE